MSTKIKITFPNGFVAHATMRDEEEPECCAASLEFLKDGPCKCVNYHTVSTGDLFGVFPRPPKHPVPAGSQVSYVGTESKMIYDLNDYDISWQGFNWVFTYGPCTEPVYLGGPVIATVDEPYREGWKQACRDCWFHQYIYHKVVIITIEKV